MKHDSKADLYGIIKRQYFLFQIMKHFSAAPMDQHIWVNGEELKGNDRLLGELGVTPGAVLLLKVFSSRLL